LTCREGSGIPGRREGCGRSGFAGRFVVRRGGE